MRGSVAELSRASDGAARSSLPRVAAVGLNYGAHALERNFADGNAFVELAGVLDFDGKLTRSVATKFGVRAFGSFEELLADESLDAVALFTPPRGRAELIRRLLRAGKHVMATKPFEMDSVAAAAVLREAADLGLALHSNSPSPALPADLAQIERWRQEYSLGRVTGAFGEVYGSYQEMADGSWMDEPDRCPLGPMFRLGIYLINDLSVLMARPEEVTCLSSRLRTGRPTPDNAVLSIRYADGALASIYATLCVQDGDAYRNSLTLHFENGSIYRNVGMQANAKQHAVLSLVQGDGRGRTNEQTVTVRADPHSDYRWDWFAAGIRGEELPGRIGPEKLVASVAVIEAMARSEQRVGAEVNVPKI